MASLQEVFVKELRDIYDGENQIVEALPKLSQKASSDELKEALSHHLEQTRGHVERLEQIFSELGEQRTTKKCKGIQGLLEEGDEALKEVRGGAARDAILIGGAQKIEHYEMATYGTLRAWAEELGHDDVADILQETLDEEADANEKLTEIAEGGLISAGVNEAATG
jgi:ferritin-like metal-binding protein YciE